MAEKETSFPKIAEVNWWKVRDLFRRRVPASVTSSYIATALSMSEASAKSNIIATFKKIGLIDNEGKPTDLAYDWRDDAKYPSVCQSIFETVYPQEVRDLYHDKEQDTSGLIPWFMSYCRCGEPAARMYVTFYRLLLRADPTEQNQAQTQPSTTKLSNSTTSTAKKVKDSTKRTKDVNDEAPINNDLPKSFSTQQHTSNSTSLQLSPTPQLHVNIQLHVSPETTAEQIDKIFESMARHLRTLTSSGN
jgi:hypothetical protein